MRRLVLALENLFFPLAAMGFLLRFIFSRRRALLRDLPEELRERFGMMTDAQKQTLSGKRVIWLHAASAGEVSAISLLVRRIKQENPAVAIIVTSSTATGRRRAQSLSDVDLALLAPLDFFWCVGQFLNNARPETLLIAETELWPQMIELSFRRGIPIALVNGRLSDKSFRLYRAAKPVFSPFLARIRKFCVQTNEDAKKFEWLGIEPSKIAVYGNMKYDAPAAESSAAAAVLQTLGWADDPVWVCASTHPGEEETLCEAYKRLKESFSNLKLVIAPRHPERADETAALLRAKAVSYSLWSELRAIPRADALLIDTLGVLSGFYGLSVACFVGGTLVPVGGHNVIEPAMAGAPVLFGPYVSHTGGTAELLERSGGGFKIQTADQLVSVISLMLKDPSAAKVAGRKARAAAESLRGATERTMNVLRGDSFFKKI